MEILQSYRQGKQYGQQQRAYRKAQQQQQTLQELSQQYMRDPNPQTIGQIAAMNPQAAQGLIGIQKQVIQNTAKRVKGISNTFNSASESQKAELYPKLIERAKQQGVDTSDMPLEYNKETSSEIQQILQSESQKADMILGKPKREREKDITGRQRYVDSGEYVFKDIDKGYQKPEDATKRETEIFKRATTLRKEFVANSKDFVKVRDSYNRIEASAKDPSPAGDLALIFNYMKVLDPGSTVREGEFATAESSGSVPSRISAKYNKILEGERLAPEQRKDFLKRSKSLYNEQLVSQKRLAKNYKGLARRAGAKEEDVLLELANIEKESIQGQQKPLSEMTIEELQALRQKMSEVR